MPSMCAGSSLRVYAWSRASAFITRETDTVEGGCTVVDSGVGGWGGREGRRGA